MQKVTAIIPCFNEEKNIRKALESVRWADEVMVVDSFSTDNTLDIAREFTDVILQREYENSASQKNWAIPQAKHDWIILLDADEWATPELEAEVKQILTNPQKDAYWIYRQNYFMGEKIRYSGWQNDRVVRLFRRSCRYEPLHVHAEVITKGIEVGVLKHKLQHNTFKSTANYLKKLERYGDWAARDYAKNMQRVGFFHLLVKPFVRFLKHYVLKLGILDGRVGFIISALAAWSVFLRYFKLMELRLKK